MNTADTSSLFERLRRLDQSRHSLPGEHWFAFALGLYFLQRRRQTLLGRAASVVTGAALVARALSGRDGAIAMWRRVEQRDAGRGDFVDVAAPWPYEERVRIAPAESVP